MKLVVVVLLTQCFRIYGLDQQFYNQVRLGENSTYFWKVNYTLKSVAVEVHTRIDPEAAEWMGVGFSNYGEISPSDMCFFWTDWKGQSYLQDTWVDKNGIVHIDEYDDCQSFMYKIEKDLLIFSFVRKFDTCHSVGHEDYVIEDGTTHIVYVKGQGPLYRLKGLRTKVAYDAGFQRCTLLYNDSPIPKRPKDTWTLEVTHEKVKVPSEETTYWCKVIKLPKALKRKHHVIQYEPMIRNNKDMVVHHMEIFLCMAKPDQVISSYEGPCHGPKRPPDTLVCSKVLNAWAMGATPFIYPEEAGLAVGGPNFNRYAMLEVHYNNPNHFSGIVDSSGFKMFLTPTLRQYDAAIMELGLEYNHKQAIPPKLTSFKHVGYCTAGCTAVALPKEGINIFASQLHTHLTGVKVYTKHIRRGKELPELNRDNHYSQHLQEIRRLKETVRVLPEDALITTCVYNTMDRDNVTLTGFEIKDEMCVNYIHYYPPSNLEVCKSSIPDSDLQAFFHQIARWEGQDTQGKRGDSENYQAIQWNPLLVEQLRIFYDNAPLSMQCNQSSGARFPGDWEELPKDQILIPLPKPRRDCAKPESKSWFGFKDWSYFFRF